MKDRVSLPVWLIAIVLPVLITVMISLGVWFYHNLETQGRNNEAAIKSVDQKVAELDVSIAEIKTELRIRSEKVVIVDPAGTGYAMSNPIQK